MGLLDAIIARMADGMEKVGAELDAVSSKIFSVAHLAGGHKPARIRAQISPPRCRPWGAAATRPRMRGTACSASAACSPSCPTRAASGSPSTTTTGSRSLQQDVASLNDYETRLTDKVQFLLDSTLGFINIEQNRTFKLLTIASVIGIPPTFVVGLYGMNFKTMPEYDWAYGYEWGLLLVVLSIIVPVVWLRLKGWF